MSQGWFAKWGFAAAVTLGDLTNVKFQDSEADKLLAS
jgi:hypothetical protein